MDILTLIKSRRTVRRYQDKPIPKRIINKIIEAGIWGPSLLALGLQPWKFVIIEDGKLIKKISDILLERSMTIGVGGNIVLRISSNTVANAKALVVIYNTSPAEKILKNFKRIYIKLAKFAELSSVAASIQNMILVAESLGIGSCWLDAPLFCEKKINKLLGSSDKLVAFLTLGYPLQHSRRSPRKQITETVKFIK